MLTSVARPGILCPIRLSAASSKLPGPPMVLRTRVAAPSVCCALACILLAAAPTATPCFRHWRRSSLLPPLGELRGAPERAILLYLRNQFRVNLFQIEFEQFGDAILLHGDAVEDVGGLHGAAAVGDDDELGLVAHPAQILREADDIGVIQRGSISSRMQKARG